MHRFYLTQKLDKEIVIIKERPMVHQFRDVLKLRKGERVVFFNNDPEFVGSDFIVELKNIDGGAANFMLRERVDNQRESSKKLILYQSLIKKDKFEWILEKATEIGVLEIVPMISARSEKKSLNLIRCQNILKEAAEQSGRAIIPRLHDVLLFDRALSMAVASSSKTYFASVSEKENMIHAVGERAMNVFIGPEGGWEEREEFAAQRANFQIISLGRLALRSETAAISATYTLLWG